MSRGDNPTIGTKSSGAAEALKYMLLEYAEQFRLQFQGDVSDFIQEQTSMGSQFESADALRDGTCESATLVPEEFTFEQADREGSAVYFYKRLVTPAAHLMYSSGNKLFSGAALAKNERGRIGGPHSVDLVQHLQYSGALTNDVVFCFVAISVFAGRKRGDCRCVRGGCH